ncbi:translation initiation factor IF-2 subunit alpha [Candidatus Nitrosocosmicus oleophilus]|uniref:Translation initiation factor 2 subunit alpha n=1 Tax=Candidatus Nitrosocosmicus oleophilus TaxID=1353260 RepID=A0A654M059_9ARCH|nr:translation initiation factor IF-2 subunit alpha [Candidatus Nitrosocosmicus oleophilus]ALI36086.1 translation initiation factor IF-2 subunit alpha [Candidatus Nitrosocosmicus oleophilus]
MSISETKKLPDLGEIVIVTVKEVTGHGAYVTLDEYDNLTAFLHISEIATGWIRNIERYVKAKQKTVLKVIRVNPTRSEVDLSLKQVTGEEKKAKVMEVKKDEKGANFMDVIKTNLGYDQSSIKEIEEKISQKYDFIYDAFETVAIKGPEVLSTLDLKPEVIEAIELESKKIQIPHIEVRAVLDITVRKGDGIDTIKNILGSVDGSKNNSKIDITYIGAPKYRITVTAENFKIAEKALNHAIEKIKTNIEKNAGTFRFTREESKKTHTNI